MILDPSVNDRRDPMVDELREAFQSTRLSGQWLVLVEDDPTVRRRLGELLGGEALIIACDWRESGGLLDLIKQLFKEHCRVASAVQLVLVGSSRWAAERVQGGLVEESEAGLTFPAGQEFERWVAGASQTQHQLQLSKRQFSGAVRYFIEKMLDESGPIDPGGWLQTLFYHAEAGMFLEYDWRQSQFRPVT